jgi:hypothetical protein
MTEGTLIDFETTGIPFKTQSWEAITLGYFNQSKVVILQRKLEAKESFYEELRRVLADLPKPFYAYNASFERDIIKHELRMEISESDFVDLMHGWKEKAESSELEWPSVSDLMSEPEDYFGEPKITGKRVPNLWNLYLTNGKPDWIPRLIVEHCLSDILREAVLLLRYPEYARHL